eukprot:CAMPEP_0119120610 /NCGR_PEP_ID=MMETSP1310-20130426/1578_1 /TAXON_ID=464262 /ORGANISM="Genus nov. species nov., Strain RCC2339" /LENGTH=254 /DNA_ID=CAMNT_0007110097 /DNA_START=25 /DNA_END=789 /DNA_ORIENTATION=-
MEELRENLERLFVGDEHSHEGTEYLSMAVGLLVPLLVVTSMDWNRILGLGCKAPLSMLFCYVGYLSVLQVESGDASISIYATLVMVGLVLGFFGDVFLVFGDIDFWFLCGLVSFLAGHLAYVAAFVYLLYVSPTDTVALLATPELVATLAGIALFSFHIYLYFRPLLRDLYMECVAYILIITSMLLSAAALSFDTYYSAEFRYQILAGSVAFYISDIFVGRSKFMGVSAFNTCMCLPLYYGGQFALGFSAALAS